MPGKTGPAVVCYGEVLWDLLPSGEKPGGAPMNVSYHVGRLGSSASLITRVGRDELGSRLLGVLGDLQVDTSFVQIDENVPTGIVHANPNASGEVEYDIVAPAAWDYIERTDEVAALVSSAEYFVCGSLVNRDQKSRSTLFDLISSAKNVVLDINLRPPHYNKEIVRQLLEKADVLKMNIAELELITGWFSDYQAVAERMKFVQDKFDIRSVIVTMGGDGAVINYKGEFLRHSGYLVTVEDTVGSGDSFLAAMLYKELSGASPQEALTFASALGALVASKAGGCPAYEKSEIVSIIAHQGTGIVPV